MSGSPEPAAGMWDYDAEIRRRIMERLREGPAWTRELGCDLRITPTIIDDAVTEMKAEGLIYPTRTHPRGRHGDVRPLAAR